jgi:RNA polymerase sigma factor (sigma-70 family)
VQFHHHPGYIDAVDGERRARLTRRRTPAHAGDLERVVRAATDGDAAAWTALFERFAARLRGVARRHRLQEHDADDVLQATWLRLFEHIGKVRDPLAIGAWLETTARNESLRVLAAGSRVSPTDDALLGDAPAASDTPEAAVVTAESRQALEAAIAALPPAQRRLFAQLLRDEATSYEEIATALGIPIGSIGPTRARGLERMREDPRLVGALGEP